MSRIQELQEAIQQLSPDDFSQLMRWVQEQHQERWEAQIHPDDAAGNLDFLWEEAREERDKGLLKNWPPSS